MATKMLQLNSEHTLTLESVTGTIEAVVCDVQLTCEESTFGYGYEPATITATLVPRGGYLYKWTTKKLKVSKTASVDVEVEPSASEILGIKEQLGLPPAAVGTYKASKGKITYKWEEEV